MIIICFRFLQLGDQINGFHYLVISIHWVSLLIFLLLLLISVCIFPLFSLKNVLPSRQSMKEQHLGYIPCKYIYIYIYKQQIKLIKTDKKKERTAYLSRRNIDHVNGHGERVDHNTHTTQKPYKRNEQKTRETKRKRSHTQLGNEDGGKRKLKGKMALMENWWMSLMINGIQLV